MERLKPKAVIIYEGKDVSADFEPILTGVSFKDYLDGRAGEIEVSLSNREGLFFGDWYPDIDDRIRLMLGYEGSPMLDAGIFWVDEVSLSGSGSGDGCSIRAMSLRSSQLNAPTIRKSHAMRPFADIAAEVAASLDCTVEGDTSGSWSGLQNESGMTFLSRVAHSLGRIVKVEEGRIIIYPIERLAEIGLLTIKRNDVISYDLKDIAAGRISQSTVKWWDAKNKKLITGTHRTDIKGGGEIVTWTEVKDRNEAVSKARDIVLERNKKGVEFSCSMLGDARLRAGVGVNMEGFGRFDGLYFISEASHSFSNSGYATNITLQKQTK